MTCRQCNAITLTPSGGIKWGGSVSPVSILPSGGIQWGGSAVWSVSPDVWWGYVGVWGLDETGTVYADQSRHSLDGTIGNAQPTPIDGVFCLGAKNAGKPSMFPFRKMGFGVAATLRSAAGRRLLRLRTATPCQRGYADGTNGDWVCSLGYSVARHVVARLQTLDADGTTHEYSCYSTVTMPKDRWHFLACTWQPGKSLSVFIDGTSQGSTSTAETKTLSLSNSGYIGRRVSGDIQDVRIHGQARDSAWLTAEHSNYCDSTFYSVGGVETGIWE